MNDTWEPDPSEAVSLYFSCCCSSRGVCLALDRWIGDGQLAKVWQPRREAADGSVHRPAHLPAGEGAPQHDSHNLPHRHGRGHSM